MLEFCLSKSGELVDTHLKGDSGVAVVGDNLVIVFHKESFSELILLSSKTISVVVLAKPVDVLVLGRHIAWIRITWIGCGWGDHF